MINRFKGRATFVRAAFVFLTTLAVFGVGVGLFHPESPVPDQWHPFKPLRVSAPVTPLTAWKLDRATDDPKQCLAVLADAAQLRALGDKRVDENCGIAPRVEISRVGASKVGPIETNCATALRLAMWEEHGIQPAADHYLGTQSTRLRHAGSYSCRKMRTSSGGSGRWSSHAQALAIDITGFDFADGSRVRLIDDWNGDMDKKLFLQAVRDSACIWFRLTLSPDYNALHADHFHLQATGWGTCR